MTRQDQQAPMETGSWSLGSTEEPVRDLAGTVLGDFDVKRTLGRGGMGQVYLATQISLSRSVALKVLHPRFLSNPAYLRRFEAEATAVAKLNHPNIVHVYTLGHIDEVRFIAMEYVEGTNLRDYIMKKGALELPMALSIMKQAGQAVAAAGEVGLVHRDIKPENILLTRKGRAKVADFGLCRDMGAGPVHMTQPGITMGTPLYMSPEQAQGKPLDHRSDLYSLGVTFYHMLCGEPPFRADSAVALALKQVNEQPASLRIRRPDIPEELERLVLKLMAKKPADRHQSAAEMLADLSRVRSSLQPTLGASATFGDEIAPTLPRAATRGGQPAGSESAEQSRIGISSRFLTALSASAALPTLASRLVRPGTLLAIATGFAVLGAAAGWATRAQENSSTSPSKQMPGLRDEPGWTRIPHQQTAEEQYRFAQLQAPEAELSAAWLAVPGFHSNAPEWVSPSYLQYARRLYRQRDGERLKDLQADLAAWPAAKTSDRELGRILECALKLYSKDLDGVIEDMSRIAGPEDRVRPGGRDDPDLIDPAYVELCVEILADAMKVASQPGPQAAEIKREKLAAIQARLTNYLRRVRMAEWVNH